ncbi:MAG: septal ring lytic transglycosylase RlpA family protein, partial [Sphingomonadales bacterium]
IPDGDETEAPPAKKGEAQKIGKPYKIAGIWYYPAKDPDYEEFGMASWYGPNFHGRPTANGEKFDMNKLTAAHRTLPLPSYIRVTNLANGRTVVLRVNDRGPFANDRILDVSRRGAQLLGYKDKGVQKVKVELVNPDGSKIKKAIAEVGSSGGSGGMFVQIGSFASSGAANDLLPKLKGLGAKAQVQKARVGRKNVYRVRVGPFTSSNKAQAALNSLQNRGFYEAKIFTDAIG